MHKLSLFVNGYFWLVQCSNCTPMHCFITFIVTNGIKGVGNGHNGSKTMYLKWRCLHERINSCVELKVGVRFVAMDGEVALCALFALFRNRSF
jgi:hypothetical protein